jgi:metallo-beta-lactamase family protein
MASEVLVQYRKRANELDEDLAQEGAGPLARAAKGLSLFATAKLRVVSTIPESRQVQESNDAAVVISASGMATGGRVLHHLIHALPDARNTVLFAGYQAAGTRGRALLEGAHTTRIHGQDIPVHAQVERLDSMSAHADANEIMRWLSGFTRPPALTCLVHGEPDPMDTLKARIERELGWMVRTPAHQEKLEL